MADNWTKAENLKIGDTILMLGTSIEVQGLKTLSNGNVRVTAKEGHNGVKGQTYDLASWQEVEVKK